MYCSCSFEEDQPTEPRSLKKIRTAHNHLSAYLSSQGINLVKGKNFTRINPEHIDKNLSCGIYMGSNNTEMFHCFSCGCAGTIFEAAHFLEDKPLSGHGFLMDTVPHLAAQFGVEIPRLDLNPEDLYEMETYQAYQHAAYIIRNSNPGERVQAKLAEYGWPKDVLSQIGIGSVSSFDDYMHKMTVTYGHKLEFLKDVDLARKGLFNENNLIYTVKDEHGSPVGFAERDLFYEQKQLTYEKQAGELEVQFANDEKGLKEARAKLFKPRKYNNSAENEYIDGETRPKNTIFKKGSRLFNFDLAKKATPPLEVFEGQPDCITAFANGMKNATAIGSTHFTSDHLDLILNADPPIKHLAFTLDADEAGKKGTASFVKLLEEKLGGHPGLKVEIRSMPDGTDDPDKFIRTCGMKAFRELPKEDLFSWRVKQAVENGEDPVLVANNAVALILNEQLTWRAANREPGSLRCLIASLLRNQLSKWSARSLIEYPPRWRASMRTGLCQRKDGFSAAREMIVPRVRPDCCNWISK